MFGIAGRIELGPAPEAEALVGRIVSSQRRRGPDAEAVTRMDRGMGLSVVFGHSRLAIIDLSQAANQPRWDAERRYGMTYNGEIYNYRELREELISVGCRFSTMSDSEVLLAAFATWREAAFARLNGMFAFALYDRQEETVWLVRDRFGVKPLFYHATHTRLSFASTGRVIARDAGLGADTEYLARGLFTWAYEGDDDRSPYSGLQALRGGHVAAVRMERGRLVMTVRPYYDLRAQVLEQQERLRGNSTQHLIAEVSAILESAVELRLRADVPIALSLSGGLDSGAVAVLAQLKTRSPVHAYSFAHPDAPNSEAAAVAALARQHALSVTHVWPASGEIGALWDAALQAQDAPFAHGSVVAQYAVFERARRDGLKVLLGGQGGDEAFMGYRKFQLFQLRQLLAARRFGRAAGAAGWLLTALVADIQDLRTYWQSWARYRRRGGSAESVLTLAGPSGDPIGFDPAGELWERQVLDVTRASLPTLLRYEDRNSMGNSIESRLPFLDYRLIELGLALPDTLKLRHGYGKWVLRKGMAGRVPRSTLWARSKRGFSVEFDRWVRGGLGKLIRERLASRADVLRTYCRPGTQVDSAFSDRALATRATAVAEVTTLIWLGEQGSG